MIVSSSLLLTQQVDVCPKKLNLTAETKLTNRMQIQGLFSSFSSVTDQNDSEFHIENQNGCLPLMFL
jgi:hypothetical protein